MTEEKCYAEPFACHSKRGEESLSLTQDKLREEPNLMVKLTY